VGEVGDRPSHDTLWGHRKYRKDHRVVLDPGMNPRAVFPDKLQTPIQAARRAVKSAGDEATVALPVRWGLLEPVLDR